MIVAAPAAAFVLGVLAMHITRRIVRPGDDPILWTLRYRLGDWWWHHVSWPRKVHGQENYPEPVRAYCETDQHQMHWWGFSFGQFYVCANCPYATDTRGRPVSTQWSHFHDGETGEAVGAHWQVVER